MIARTACPASAFAAGAFAIAVLSKAVQRPMMIFRPQLFQRQDQGTEPEDWQEIPASAGLPKLSEFMIYLYITDGPESLLAHHLASIARDAFLH